ncbi:MAG: adenylate kinase [Nitrososphaerota archaeon]|nr:adenylate kinase [Nitrososphaerota archaeon]
MTEQRRRRVVIVGIPGVGKSTVVTRIAELMSESKLKLEVVNYGSVMLEEASKRHGVRSRDDMRKLPVEVQRELQVNAAASISKMRDEYTLIDTHLFIATREGFWPGMPMDVIKALKPTHLILVSASVEEIKKRRENDPTRARDHATIDSLNNELDVARHLLFSSSLVCGCPALVITNSDGQVDLAAQNVIKAVFRS